MESSKRYRLRKKPKVPHPNNCRVCAQFNAIYAYVNDFILSEDFEVDVNFCPTCGRKL